MGLVIPSRVYYHHPNDEQFSLDYVNPDPDEIDVRTGADLHAVAVPDDALQLSPFSLAYRRVDSWTSRFTRHSPCSRGPNRLAVSVVL